MRGMALFFILGCLAFAGEPVLTECRATVTRSPEGFIVSPAQWLPIVEVFALERCGDVQFKNGGVIVRYVIDGKPVVKYFPASKLEHVVVERTQQ